MAPGDWIVYYSPRTRFPDGEPWQRFTAIGQVSGGEVYAVQMSDGFAPFRRAVRFLRGAEAPVQPLLPRLAFIRDSQRWGYIFRRGHFEITERDFRLIATAMGVESSLATDVRAAPNALPDPA